MRSTLHHPILGLDARTGALAAACRDLLFGSPPQDT